MRGWLALAGALAVGAALVAGSSAIGQAAVGQVAIDHRARLAEARRGAAIAAARADQLAAAAASERNAAARARIEAEAAAARVDAAAARVAAAQERGRLVEALLADQRRRLAIAQAPVARVLAAVQSIARRPAIVAVAQPGSVADMIRIRAVLGTTLPAIRTRTAALRADLGSARQLQQWANASAGALRDDRQRLESDRQSLARMEADHRGRSVSLGRNAMSESDRALALGERARDLVDTITLEGDAKVTAASLVALPGPAIRPGVAAQAVPRGVYRLPAAGRLITGFGELSDAGVRSRGLTMAVAPGAGVVAPAAGTIRFARRFRDYGVIVVIDHADGWSTTLTGLADSRLTPGANVAAGAPVGRAGGGDEPTITVELRRNGHPMDIAALIG